MAKSRVFRAALVLFLCVNLAYYIRSCGHMKKKLVHFFAGKLFKQIFKVFKDNISFTVYGIVEIRNFTSDYYIDNITWCLQYLI